MGYIYNGKEYQGKFLVRVNVRRKEKTRSRSFF